MESNLADHDALITNLRVGTAWRIVLLCIVAVWLWMVVGSFGWPQPSTDAMMVLVALLAGTALSYLVTQIMPMLAPLCAAINLTVATTVAIVVTGNAAFADLYAIPVLVAGTFIQPWAGIVAALLVNLLLLAAGPLQAALALPPLFSPSIPIMTALAALVAWVFAHDFYTVTAWMYGSFLLAEERTDEAREHRARLYETLKNLDLAYDQLRRANEALHWARQQAEESRQAKARFVANVSHELRTPLNLIIGFSDMMVTAPESYGEPIPPVYRGDLNAIYRNAKHLASLINDVLDLSQIEAERMLLSRETGDLRQVAQEAAKMVQGMIATKGLDFRIDLPDEPLPLSLDITRIRQVILNLLSNAVRFTNAGSIALQLVQEEDRAQVTVIDTGPGINPAEVAQLFEEFYQIDDSIRREHGGTGLGLAISKRFVELHGGRIWVESEPGRGSTFGFELPIQPQFRTESRRPMQWNGMGVATERILVVMHDDPGTTTMLARHLDTHHVHAVHSLAAMQEAVLRYAPTAVIVDVSQRAAAAEQLSAMGELTVPLISFPLPTLPQMAEKLQIANYLLKPITRAALSQVIAQMPTAGATILIADDDPAMARLLTRMLQAEQMQARILQAHNGVAALNIIRQEQPEMLLLDLQMPGLSGLELLATIQQEPALQQKMAVIVITATGLGEQIAHFDGELMVSLPYPLAASEWLSLLGGVTTALRPVSGSTVASGRAAGAVLPG